jgi:hypothetical protein
MRRVPNDCMMHGRSISSVPFGLTPKYCGGSEISGEGTPLLHPRNSGITSQSKVRSTVALWLESQRVWTCHCIARIQESQVLNRWESRVPGSS